jgi:hypothetical protein
MRETVVDMNAVLTARFTRNVLGPAWITVFGLACMIGPAQGVAASLAFFMAGVFGLPALVLVCERRVSAPSVRLREA